MFVWAYLTNLGPEELGTLGALTNFAASPGALSKQVISKSEPIFVLFPTQIIYSQLLQYTCV